METVKPENVTLVDQSPHQLSKAKAKPALQRVTIKEVCFGVLQLQILIRASLLEESDRWSAIQTSATAKTAQSEGQLCYSTQPTSTFHLHTRFTHCLQDFVPFTLSYLQPLSHVL